MHLVDLIYHLWVSATLYFFHVHSFVFLVIHGDLDVFRAGVPGIW